MEVNDIKVIYDIANFLWTYVIAYALLGMGLYYTIRLGVPQIKYFKRTIVAMKNNIKSNDNVSGFATLCAAVGGQVGTGSLVGVARGLFSNDAGNGLAAIMHATADVKHPAEQGMLSMLGTFITTCVICSFTAFAILSTNVLPTGYEGINLLQEAFYTSMGVSGRWIVFLAIFLFAFTTLLADIYYGEVNIVYIFKKKSNIPIWIYRILTAIILLISCKIELKAI